MQESYEDKIKRYNEKTDGHLQNWKKIRALVNFSKTIDDFKEWEALEFIIRFYQKGYLWESQEKLLDELLAYYKIDYTKWAVKDGWVKMQMINGFKCKRSSQQLEFWFQDLEEKKIEARYKWPVYSKLERYKLLQLRD